MIAAPARQNQPDKRRIDPDRHGIGIVHIGPGAFHRAHQAVYTHDALLAAGGDWRIEAVSLRSRAVAEALNAQGGRYTLVVRGEAGSDYRTVGAIAGARAAARGMAPIHAALDRPETRIVSLTVTEKAYVAPASAGPAGDKQESGNRAHGERPEDGQQEEDQQNVIALVTAALGRRRAAGLPPFTLLSCDNLRGNGAVLRRAVLDHARTRDGALADWIASAGRFPSTMVDRITPATTTDLVSEVAAATGRADRIPVETEAFSQWVIEDDFATGRPAWEAAGARMVRDVAPWEHMKLRMLNGAHSMLACAGHVAGKTFVRDAMADPALAALVRRHMDAAAATLDSVDDLDPPAWRDALLARFRNPRMAHETRQIAMDGSQKLPHRIFAPALAAAGSGQDTGPFAFAFAAWLRYLDGQTDAGVRFAPCDPRATELAALPAGPEARVDAACALPDLVPAALAANQAFRCGVARRLRTMVGQGMAQAMLAELHD